MLVDFWGTQGYNVKEMIPPGQLRWRISLYSQTKSVDNSGQEVLTPVLIAAVWADYKAKVGTERYTSDVLATEYDATFLIRWRTDIDDTVTLSFENKTYNILSIDEVGFREGLLIKAKYINPSDLTN